MDITDPKINDYIMNTISKAPLPECDSILKKMELYAKKSYFPIIGPVVGRFLRQLAIATAARRIFEMGSGFGYSAIWFASGLSDGGKIICTDSSEKNKQMAMNYFKQAGYESRVEFYVGDALDIIKQFDEPFDVIYNDIDKEQYPKAFDLAIPRLKKSGLFITDNVLWSGMILNENPDEVTKGIIEFNRKLFASQEILASIIPIRDGLGIAVKL